MSRPVLIQPADHSRFHLDQMIQFEWRLAPMRESAAIKLTLCIGRNSAAPCHDRDALKRRWLFTPNDPWTRYNETARHLGLELGKIFYWQVVQLPGDDLISDVRALHIEAQARPRYGLLRLDVSVPYIARPGSLISITASLHNTSSDPIRVSFKRGLLFTVRIYRKRRVGGEQITWMSQPPPPWIELPTDSIEIPAHQTYRKLIIWPQLDLHGHPAPPGDYCVEVQFNANGFNAKRHKKFQIIR